MIRTLVAGLAAVLLWVNAPAHAQDHHRPGDFDFYVLALTWSPSYCAIEGADADRHQCGARPFAFVVHGLWPQYERGFPEYCNRSAPRIPQRVIDNMLDVMPSPRLIINQWRKHGTCTGLDDRGYFNEVRDARERVTVPQSYRRLDDYLSTDPAAVEQAFLEANPGLPASAISITCNSRFLREVRICMTRDLKFRPCPELDRRSCRADRVVMPPVRGG